MSAYGVRQSEAFASRLEEIERRDPEGYRRIRRVMERLTRNPEAADGRMHTVHHGRLKKYVGRRDYRIIYDWCEGCRRANRHLEAACPRCEAIEDHTVVFLDVYHKKDAKRVRP